MDISVNSSMVKFVSSLIEEGKRYDGRDFLKYRNLKVVEGYIPNAEGSAYVELGDTKVLVGIKLEVSEPFPDLPDEGFFVVSLEYLPGSHYEKEPGPPSPREIEYARVVDRIIRGSGFINTKELCIESGKYVWSAFIDIYIINNDGNIADASLIAAIKALKNTYFPKLVKEGDKYVIDYKEKTKRKLPINEDRIPVSFTFIKIGDKVLLDPNLYEEEAADSIINIGITDRVHSVQFLKSSLVSLEELENMIEIAEEQREKIMKYLK